MNIPESVLKIDPAMLAQIQAHGKKLQAAVHATFPEGLQPMIDLAERIKAMPVFLTQEEINAWAARVPGLQQP